MDSLIGVLIFIVVVILSLASKAQEARKIAERQKEKQLRKPQQLSGRARQQIHGRAEPRTATAREGATPPPVPPARPVRKPKPVEQELLETLFGVKLSKDDEETAQQQPQREPQVREATQQMVQRLRGQGGAQPRAAQPRGAARPPADAGDEGPTITAEDVRAKEKQFEHQIRALRERMHQGMRQGLAQAPQKPEKQKKQKRTAAEHPARKPPARPVRVRRESPLQMFATGEDVRRAIIASEILGPPKSMRSDEAAA